MEKPYVGKAIINEISGGYKIEIPAPRNWFVVIFMTAWLGGWAMGWTFAFTSVMQGVFDGGSDVDLFLTFWLVGWTIGGFFVMKTLYWMIFGKEIITINHRKLEIKRSGDLLGKSKSYDLIHAKEFAIVKKTAFDFWGNNQSNNPFMSNKMGTLKFDYGLKTIRFGIGIDEAEGKYLLEKFISKRLIA